MSSPRPTPITASLAKLRGWLLCLKVSPKLICHDEKVVGVFHHPPKDQQAEEFDCWALDQFVHITEEGEESAFLDRLTGGGENIAEGIQVAKIINKMSELTETKDSNDIISDGDCTAS